MYHSDSEIYVGKTNWVPNLGKWRKQRLHCLHLIFQQRQMANLLHKVLWDKHVDNYKLLIGQEKMKRIMRDI